MTRKGLFLAVLGLLVWAALPSSPAEARYYHPTMGRWVQRDPIGYAGGINLLVYCASRPTIALDPRGMDWGGPTPIPNPQVQGGPFSQEAQQALDRSYAQHVNPFTGEPFDPLASDADKSTTSKAPDTWSLTKCHKVNIGKSILEAKLYEGVGFGLEGGLEATICDCCKGGVTLKEGYTSGGLDVSARVGLGVGAQVLGTGWAVEGPGAETHRHLFYISDCDGKHVLQYTLQNTEVHISLTLGGSLWGYGLKGVGEVVGALDWNAEMDASSVALTVEPSVSENLQIRWSAFAFSSTSIFEYKVGGKGRLGYDWKKKQVIADWTGE